MVNDLFDIDQKPADEGPRARLFRDGKAMLVGLGVSEKTSGRIIGRWLKDLPDADGILAAISYAYEHVTVDPIAYITAIINQNRPTNGRGANRESFSERIERLSSEARRAEHNANAGRPPFGQRGD